MGNNLLNVCKTVNGDGSEKSESNQDQQSQQLQSQQQQQTLKDTEKRKQERRIKTNRSSVKAKEGLSSQQDQSIAGKSKVNVNSIDLRSTEGGGGLGGNDGIMQQLLNGQEINSIEGGGGQWMMNHNSNSISNSQDHSNGGSPKKSEASNCKVNASNSYNSKNHDSVVETFEMNNNNNNHLPKNGITTAAVAVGSTNGSINQGTNEQSADQVQEEEALLKNNNDKYFSKEDLIYYELIRRNTEKKTTVHRDKNIRWQPGEVLGSGSFGQVILGMNIDTGEFMAVKQIHIGGYNQADRKEKVQQIQSEIEALQNFSDKHIVRYIGIKKSENSINIFLEYVPGGSISSLLYRYNKFNETLIRKFTTQILKGLEYLHSNEIIHRDIKGANVLVDKDGNCKLADFGSAKKIVEEKGHNDSIRGTPYWMAPETIKQVGSGRFADIWSIGCTVIEMATAKPPWADKTPIQAMFYIANATQAPPIPEHLSPECKDFVSKCLRISPSERYNVRQLLNHPFITGIKSTNMGQSSKLLARITEETTLEGQTTSSPDRRKDFSSRMESRGNTLFREEQSMLGMTDTKILSIKSKTFQSNKNVRKNSDSERSIDSLEHPQKPSLRQINSRNIHTRHATSGSAQERDDSSSRDKLQQDSVQQQSSKNQRKMVSSNSNINSSSSSSSNSSGDEHKQTGQITSKSLKTNKSAASNHTKINQVANSDGFPGENNNALTNGVGGGGATAHEAMSSQSKQTQPLLSLFSGRQSIGKHHTVNNLSTDNNEYYDDNDKESSNNSTNQFTNQLTARGLQQQMHTNTSITLKDGTMKRQEKEGSVASTFKMKKMQQDMTQDQEKNQEEEEEQEMSHVRLVQKGSEGKIPGKIGDGRELDLSSSSSSSFTGGDGKEGGGEEKKTNNNMKKIEGVSVGGSQRQQKNGEMNDQPDQHNYKNESQQQSQSQQLGAKSGVKQTNLRAQQSFSQSEEIEFDQGAVNQIIQHQTTLLAEHSQERSQQQQQSLPIRRIKTKTSRQQKLSKQSMVQSQQQPSDTNQPEDKESSMNSSSFGKMESFGAEKFGRFRYNLPASPKLLSQISNGPTLNGYSQEHILLDSTKQGCLATSESFLPLKTLNTQKLNQFTSYFNNQEQLITATATSNSIQDQHYPQTGNTINGNNNSNYNIRSQPTSIDQNMLQQFQALSIDKQKQ